MTAKYFYSSQCVAKHSVEKNTKLALRLNMLMNFNKIKMWLAEKRNQGHQKQNGGGNYVSYHACPTSLKSSSSIWQSSTIKWNQHNEKHVICAPSEHETLTGSWSHSGSTSEIVAQHGVHFGLTACVLLTVAFMISVGNRVRPEKAVRSRPYNKKVRVGHFAADSGPAELAKKW